MRSVVALTMLASTIALSACGDDSRDEAGVIQPKGPDPTAVSSRGTVHLRAVRIDSARKEYRFSKRTCRVLGPARVAYENNEGGTITEIARKWAERTAGKAAWRKAAFDGCLAGFAARSRSTRR